MGMGMGIGLANLFVFLILKGWKHQKSPRLNIGSLVVAISPYVFRPQLVCTCTCTCTERMKCEIPEQSSEADSCWLKRCAIAIAVSSPSTESSSKV